MEVTDQQSVRAARCAAARSEARWCRDRLASGPPHQVTTRNLGAAYPLPAEPGLGHRGVLVGHDLLGGSFV
jgi:hypothetical protein